MNRRRFFTTIFLASGMAYQAVAETTGFGSVFSHLMNFGRRKEIPLKVGDVHIVRMNTILKLPTNPKDGDAVLLGISNQTLRFPAVLRSDSAAILGDHEELILDTFSNIRLTYDVKTNNWALA